MTKRLLSLLLAAAMLLTLAACGSHELTVDEFLNKTEETHESHSNLPAETPAAANSIEETILVNEAGLRITALDLTPGTGAGPTLELLIENNTGKLLSVESEMESLNGCMVESFFQVELADRETVYDRITFVTNAVADAGISSPANIGELCMTFVATELDSEGAFLDTYLRAEQVRLTTANADSRSTTDDSGELIYEDSLYKIVLQQARPDDPEPPFLQLYIENRSDQTIYLNIPSVRLNGQESADDAFIFFNDGIAPGMKCVESIWLSDAGEERFASPVDSIDFEIQILDSRFAYDATTCQSLWAGLDADGSGSYHVRGSAPAPEAPAVDTPAQESPAPEVPAVEPDSTYDPVISAYLAYLDSYEWVNNLPADELPDPSQYAQTEWGSYYFYDFNADGIQEMILVVGTSMSSSHCLIYTYKNGIVPIGMEPCAYGVGVAYIAGTPTIVLCEFHGEYENFTAITVLVEQETMDVASSLALLPEGSVAMEPMGIGRDYPGPMPSEPDPYEPPYAPSEPDEPIPELPDVEVFLDYVRECYSGYDLSGMFADPIYYDTETHKAHCTVYVPFSYAYAEELMVLDMVCQYSIYDEVWREPSIWGKNRLMTWYVDGLWTLEGEGSFGGGKEQVLLEILWTTNDQVECNYELQVEEKTFGVSSFSSVANSGSFWIEDPKDVIGTRDCWLFVDDRDNDVTFYLNPEVGVYYRSGNSLTITPQAMTRAE